MKISTNWNWVWKLLAVLIGITLITGSISYVGFYFNDTIEHEFNMPALVFLVSGTISTTFLFFLIPTWILMVRYFPPVTVKNAILHSLAISGVSVVAFLVGKTLVANLIKKAVGYIWTTQDVSMSALISVIGVILTSGLYYVNYFYRKSVSAENDRIEAQLLALKSQINPHFLFNSLNSIAALIRTSPSRAESVTEDLAEVFRYSLISGNLSTITLREELYIVGVYLNIERARFGDRLIYSVEADDASLKAVVPVLLLQPLVENAVKHGVGKSEQPVKVALKAWLETSASGKTLLGIRLSDTGPGFFSTDLSEILPNGVGLRNIYQRLQNLYNKEFLFLIHKDGIEIKIPQQISK